MHLIRLPGPGHLGNVEVIISGLQLHLCQARLDAVILTHKVPDAEKLCESVNQISK